jgi:hypothetical protein
MVTFFEDRMVIRIMNENQSNTKSFYKYERQDPPGSGPQGISGCLQFPGPSHGEGSQERLISLAVA